MNAPGEMPIHLRHPRERKDTSVQALVDRIYALVAGKTLSEAEELGGAPGRGRTRPLPVAHLNAVAGLLEHLTSEGGRADLYRLGSELMLELDEVLPVVEACELLGFLRVQEGDLMISSLGKAYAEASILSRKEMLAGRVLRLPLIGWIYETLQQDDNQRVAKDYFLEKLHPEFHDLAGKQVDAAVNWGRFAELFAFDDDTDELYLDDQQARE